MKPFLVVFACCIYALGLVMIYNTTSAEILDMKSGASTHLALFKQLAFGALGLWGAYRAYRLGIDHFIRLSPLFLALAIALLVACFLPGIGRAVNGSHRWIALGPISLQPSEFVKIILPAYLIYRLQKAGGEKVEFFEFLKISGLLLIPLGLILLEPNNGTVGVIVLTLATVCWLMGVKLKYWALPLAICLALLSVAAVSLPYVRARLTVYLNPELDLQGKGHQPYQAKIASGSGGLWGVGPGRSLQKMSYLPEAQNDYIAAIYAEEFGYAGVMTLIALYGALVAGLFSLAHQSESPGQSAFIGSLTFLIGFQTFMNLGVVSGLLPSTGLNLPFFSQGGTSLIANICALGLILGSYESRNRSRRHRRPPLSRSGACRGA